MTTTTTLLQVLSDYVNTHSPFNTNQNKTTLTFDDGLHTGQLLVYFDNRKQNGSLVIQQVQINPTGGNILLPCIKQLGNSCPALKHTILESILSDAWIEKLLQQGMQPKDWDEFSLQYIY